MSAVRQLAMAQLQDQIYQNMAAAHGPMPGNLTPDEIQKWTEREQAEKSEAQKQAEKADLQERAKEEIIARQISQAKQAATLAKQRTEQKLRAARLVVSERANSAGRMVLSVPTPGGLWIPLIILLVLFVLLIKVAGHSRLNWLWNAVTGNAKLNPSLVSGLSFTPSAINAIEQLPGASGFAPTTTQYNIDLGSGTTGTTTPPTGIGTVSPQPTGPIINPLSYSDMMQMTEA